MGKRQTTTRMVVEMERTEIGIGNMRIDVVDDNVVYINLNGWTYYIDDSTKEQILEKYKEKEWINLSIVQVPKLWYQEIMNRADITDLYGDDEPNILIAEGFDEAIAGVVWDGERTRVVYDTELILELLMGRSEMSYEEAVEYFDFNIAGSHMGEYTPLYLET